jgi:glycosyltransferase involved in cell wall biosynthesis
VLAPFVQSGALVLHGHVPYDELVGAYQSAEIIVLPTLSDGFGLVVYEAMACGLPVVVTDRCGAAVEDGRSGLVVPHADADALAGALRRLLENPELAQSLGATGLALARGSSWERYREEFSEVLGDLDPGLGRQASALHRGGSRALLSASGTGK